MSFFLTPPQGIDFDQRHNLIAFSVSRNVGFFAQTAKTFAGPIPQDAIDSILYRKGFAELGVTNLPFYSAYDLIGGEGFKKELRAVAREIDTGKPRKSKKKKNKEKLGYRIIEQCN